MAFNLGAFAGGLAKGGSDTYVMLKEQARRDQEAEQRAKEFAQKEKIWGQEEAIQQAVAETGAQVGTGFGSEQARMLREQSGEGEFGSAALGAATATGQEAVQRAQAAGGVPAGLPIMDKAQARAAALDRVRGIDWKTADVMEKSGLELSGLRRQESRSAAEDEFHTWLGKAQAQVAADPVKFVRDNLNEYNKPKPGSHLDDKLTGDVVASADGKAYSFVQKDAKGKVVSSTPIDQTTALAGLQQLAFNRYMALPGKFKEAAELGQKERQIGVQESELAEKIRVGLFGAQAKQALGAANASNAHAGVYNNMIKLGNESRDARAAMKPYLDEYAAMSPEDQAGAKGQSVLLKGATAAAQKSGDITGIVNTLKKPDVDQAIKVNADGTVTKGGVLYVPDPSKPGEYKPAGGLGQSALDKAIAAELKGGNKTTPAKAATPGKAAIPATPAKPAEYGNISPELRSESQARLQAAESALAAAEVQAQAAVRSGDVKAITSYGAEVNRLRAERDKLASSPLLK